jgi:hypothetical protein
MTDEMRKHLEECHGLPPLGPHPFKKGDWVGRRIPISYELNLDEVMNTRTTDRHEWMEGDGSWHPCPGFVAYSVERVTR